MKAIQVIEKGNQRVFNMDAEKLIGVSTKSLYIRTGRINGTLFISQRGNGAGGAGDICTLDVVNLVDIKSNLFDRLKIYAIKANAII